MFSMLSVPKYFKINSFTKLTSRPKVCFVLHSSNSSSIWLPYQKSPTRIEIPSAEKCRRHNHTADVNEYDSRIELRPKFWPRSVNFSHVWLRDHCRCSQCYNHRTFQRINDVFNIPINLKPLSVICCEKELSIKWPDGHESSYDFKFLWENCYEGHNHLRKNVLPITWTRNSFPSLERIEVPLSKFKGHDGQKKLIEAILQYGVGLVSEVPPTAEATREAVEILCMVKRTFFGEMWAFQADLEHADTAYSNEYLGPHTDTTYLSEASRIQIFHCLQAAKEGGNTLLVDGFWVGNQLRKSNPKSYDFLSSVPIPSEYIENGQHHKSLDLIFKHHPITKALIQFRYNIYDRAPLSSIPYEKMLEFYVHLQKLTALVRQPSNEIQIPLQPGRVMFLDNWRIMHGRTEYQGPRIMGGCYLDNADFTSKARVLGFAID